MDNEIIRSSLNLEDEQKFSDEVNSELFKSRLPIQMQKRILENVNDSINSSSEDDSIDSSSEDDCKIVHPTSEEEDLEDLHEIEKNIHNIEKPRSCYDTLSDLFMLKIAMPIFFIMLNISFFCQVYQKEFISICLLLFGLIVFGIYVYSL